MNPVSVLVIDEDAFRKAKRFYNEEYKKLASTDFCRWMEEEEVDVWFRRLFLNEGGRGEIHRFTRTLSDRILIISDRNDEVFPLEAIRKNLGEFLRYQELLLGRHEFPFNFSHLQGKSFNELAEEIRESSFPSEKYAASFSKWLDAIENFFFSNR
jgi:hypothetical protein